MPTARSDGFISCVLCVCVLGILGNKLCEAAEAGDVPGLVRLIKCGVKPWTADYDGRTAAHLAAAAGHIKVLALLAVQPGVELDVQDRWGSTPMRDAIRNGKSEVVAWLKEKGHRLHDTESSAGQLLGAAKEGDSTLIANLIAGTDSIPDLSSFRSNPMCHALQVESIQT